MKPITLYRRAIRSGRVEMMQEVIVRLSTQIGTEHLVDSLVNRVQLLTEDRSVQERVERILEHE